LGEEDEMSSRMTPIQEGGDEDITTTDTTLVDIDYSPSIDGVSTDAGLANAIDTSIDRVSTERPSADGVLVGVDSSSTNRLADDTSADGLADGPALFILQAPITRGKAHQLTQELNSYQCSPIHEIENRLVLNDVIVLRNEEKGHQGCDMGPRERAQQAGSRTQLYFKSNSKSRTSL
jgi:hypothetical protein